MSFTLPKKTVGGGFEIPTGTYIVRLKTMEKFESDHPQYGRSERVKWVFGIDSVVDSDDDDPERVVGEELWAFTSYNMNARSVMCAYVEALLGRTLDEDEEPDVSEVIGKRAKASVVPHTRQDGTASTKLGALMPYKPRGRRAASEDAEESDELF